MEIDHSQYIEGFLKHLSHLNQEEIDVLRPQLEVKAYRKKEFFLERGQVQKGLGFIMEGLTRRYYINEKGNDITTGFNKEYEYITDYPAFIRQKPTKYFLQCLEPSIILTIPYVAIKNSYARTDEGQKYGRLMA
ncbi:MAG: cyclic nucleotide-binding domain-containing protein, partial [Bacteroidota bacterium]